MERFVDLLAAHVKEPVLGAEVPAAVEWEGVSGGVGSAVSSDASGPDPSGSDQGDGERTESVADSEGSASTECHLSRTTSRGRVPIGLRSVLNPPTAVGYPPTAVAYPPTAVG